MACDCCTPPCNGGTGVRNDCCCNDPEAVGDCITMTIVDGITFNVTGGDLCAGTPYAGSYTCGDCTVQVRVKCEDGILVVSQRWPVRCNEEVPSEVNPDIEIWRCGALESDDPAAFFGDLDQYFGPHDYSCCPFYSENLSGLASTYDCACLLRQPTYRTLIMTKCPPPAPLMGAFMARAKARAEGMKAAGVFKARPHPCGLLRGDDEPCGRAERGVYTPDQCHLCWFFENDPSYRLLWGGTPRVRTTVTKKVVHHGGSGQVARVRQGKTVVTQEPQRQTARVRYRGRPGTELKQLLAAIGVVASATGTCNCDPHIATMNEWGVEGCKANRDVIVKWLQDDSAKMASYEGDPAELDWGPMVDEAIRLAEEKERQGQ